MMELSYRRHRFPPVVIQHAVWLYLRFTLSYRDVEDLLAERGLDVSYETVRSWVLKFGPVIAGTGLHAPHPPFAISAGIGAIGWTSALPDFLAGDAHTSKAVICRLHPMLRLFQPLPAGPCVGEDCCPCFADLRHHNLSPG